MERIDPRPDTHGDEALARRLQQELQQAEGVQTSSVPTAPTAMTDEQLALLLAEEETPTAPCAPTAPAAMTDEQLARLLAEEESRSSGQAELPEPPRPPPRPQSPPPCEGLSDQELAELLQKEEEEEAAQRTQRSEGGAGVAGVAADGAARNDSTTDAELASLLQQEEEEAQAAAMQRQARRSPRSPESELTSLSSSPRPRRQHLPERLLEGSGADCIPHLAATLGCGDNVPAPAAAASGCFAGCQIASCLNLSYLAMLICMIGGGAIGYAASNAPEFPGMSRFNSDESDDDEEPELIQRGLDEAVIESSTVDHVYRGPQQPQQQQSNQPSEAAVQVSASPCADEENKCMICMEQFTEGEMLRTLPCLHRYHRPCIDEWLHRSTSCPICKRDVTDRSAPIMAPTPARGGRRLPRNILRGLVQRVGRGGRARPGGPPPLPP